MAIQSRTFTLLAFLATAVYMTALIIAFASDRWIVSTEDTGLLNLGLWSICFKQYRPPSWVQADKYMDECFWTLDKELEDLDYLFPSWFVATQTLVTVSLVLGFIAGVVMVINAINCFPYNRHRTYIQQILCVASFILHFIVVLLLFIAIIMFGVRSDSERDWVDNPDDLYLSWSFGMAVLADFLALIAGLCLIIEYFRLRVNHGLDKVPGVILTNHAPPVTSSYGYSRENLSNPNQPPGNNYRGQPEYARKLNGSQGSLNRPGNDPSVFKVSGSGQLYVNRLAEHEENAGQTRQPPQNRGNNQPPLQDTRDRPDNNGGQRREATRPDHRDYEEARKAEQHPVLPEYVPKSKSTFVDGQTTEDSDLDDIPKKDFSDTDSEDQNGGTARSKTKSKKSSGSKGKSRSHSDKRTSKKKSKHDHSEDERTTNSSRKKSKKQSGSSDNEGTRSRKRSKDRITRRKSSRSRSRDLNESYSDDYLDSDHESTRGRSRKKSRGGNSRTGSRHRTPSGDRLASGKSKRSPSKERSKRRNRYDEDYSDNNISGSEYSSRVKSKTRAGRGRDYSDTESVRTKARRKPEQSYSSYYEY